MGLNSESSVMTPRTALRALIGAILLVTAFWLVRSGTSMRHAGADYHERTYLIDANGCHLETTVLEPMSTSAKGTVILLHGLAANKKIMSYMARGFAEQSLRVFVPDLPGHGHTLGSFSAARAEECSAALVDELRLRGLAPPQQTILAGHSMGGAIAIRIANRFPVAGVVAVSPAPMKPEHGVRSDMLLFPSPAPIPPNTLVINGRMETPAMKDSSADLVAERTDRTAKYLLLSGATHVSLLFDSRVMRESQDWAAHLLRLDESAALPSKRPLWGALFGFVGLLFLLGPFLREAIMTKKENPMAALQIPLPLARRFAIFAIASFLAVFLLRLGNPVQRLRIFEGDYLAAFLLILGFVLFLLWWKPAVSHLSVGLGSALRAAFAGLVIFLLFSAWFELSFSESWLASGRWIRVPFLFVTVLPSQYIEELLLGPASPSSSLRRLSLGLSLRFIVWIALLVALFALHSGAILLVLLGPYLALFSVLQRRGMDVVRQDTGSAGAAAVFGAILLAGFCLVVFPVT